MSDVTTELAKEANDKAMEIARIKAENDRLRESVKRLMTQRDGRLARAEADNAELRELARQMYPKAKAFLQMGVRLGCNDTLSYDWYLQLRELGVEVDG